MAIQYATDETFRELTGGDYALVDFFGKTCVPCKVLARVLEEIDDEMPFVNIVKVDVDDCPKITKEFGIVAMPDVYFMKNGKVVFHSTGLVDADVIRQKLAEIMY